MSFRNFLPSSIQLVCPEILERWNRKWVHKMPFLQPLQNLWFAKFLVCKFNNLIKSHLRSTWMKSKGISWITRNPKESSETLRNLKNLEFYNGPLKKSGNGSFLEKLKKRSYIPSLIFDYILKKAKRPKKSRKCEPCKKCGLHATADFEQEEEA